MDLQDTDYSTTVFCYETRLPSRMILRAKARFEWRRGTNARREWLIFLLANRYFRWLVINSSN